MPQGDIHLNIEIVGGSKEQQSRFHQLCYFVDPTWPFVTGLPNQAHYRNRRCQSCRGRIYKAPNLTPQDIKAAARQCGVHVKIRQYSPLETCYPNGGECVIYPANLHI